MTLGEQLTVRQKRSGLTREDIKEATGLSLPTIRKIFNDNKRVFIDDVEKVATAIGVERVKYTVEP